MEEKKICDKCGSTNFGSHFYAHQIGKMPYIDYVSYCEDCGEIHKDDRDRYYIESANFFSGEIILKNKSK